MLVTLDSAVSEERPMMLRWTVRSVGVGLIAAWLFGCSTAEKDLHYLGDADLQYYKETAAEIDYPHVHEDIPDEVLYSSGPRTVLNRHQDTVWDLSLEEAIQTALSNSRIIRTQPNGGGGAPRTFSDPILTNPDRVSAIYDPAIQESGVLFQGRGVEAALSAFDTQFAASMLWGRNELPVNTAILPGFTSTSETGNFRAGLSKAFAYGAELSLGHDWNYLQSNAIGQLFPSSYTGSLDLSYRHPLLAGAGTEFTRIAGPVTQSFGGLTGVTQGVVIARINNDITLADFEASVRELLKNVEDAYWTLYLSYRNYDTAITARNSTLRSWREAKAKLDIGGVRNFKPADEAQARDQYFETRSFAETALSSIYTGEAELRRLMGLSVNDGRIIRPADEPTSAQLIPDWTSSMTEALVNRVELRRQKWNIKSLELQLSAAKSLTRPRLDFVGGYSVNGFGDRLLEYNDGGAAKAGWGNGYSTITQGDHTGWDLGFELSMPIGLRSAHAQVRNIELRMAKARDILATQEVEISHQLADSFQQLALHFVTAQSNFNRRQAAERRVQLFDAEVREGTKTLDELLRAQRSLAAAEVEYFTSLINYSKAIVSFNYAKGTLLEMNNVHLAEGDWTEQAYHQAIRRAWARSYAFGAPESLVRTEPIEFDAEYFDCTQDDGILPAAYTSTDDVELVEPPPAPTEAAQ
jgi:outer membrane protein TolC